MDANGLNKADFARKISVPRSTLVGWLEGKVVSIGILKTLEKQFSINIDWFLTGEGEMFLEGQNAVENSEQYDEKTARIAELEEKIKALENQEARVKSLEAENKELEAENKQLSEDLLEMVRKFVIAPKAAKA
jgi:flagellar motility protein MotE (MotC chaperone)